MREISHRNMSNFFTSFTRLLILLAVLCFPQFVTSLELDLNDHEALRDAAALVAEGLMDYYTGNQYGKDSRYVLRTILLVGSRWCVGDTSRLLVFHG